MDYTIFVKNKFLSTTIGDFSKDLDKTDYKGFEKIVTRNTIFGMGKVALAICRKSTKSVFYEVDGMPVKQGDTFVSRKDGYVDKDEMYQLIRNSYELVNGEKITNEQISKLTIKEAVDIAIEYWDKKNEAK